MAPSACCNIEEEGYLPDALLNYLVRLGWSHGDQESVHTRGNGGGLFDIKDVNKAASAFNPEKLLWLNQQHLMRTPVSVIATALGESLARLGVQTPDRGLLEGVVNAQRERARTLAEMAQNSLFFFREFEHYDEKAARKNLTAETAPLLHAVGEAMGALAHWDAASIHTVLNDLAAQLQTGLGKIAQPLRVAVTGTAVSPPIDATLALLGRACTLKRIDTVLAKA
jgi:glutamyl-tRNA synthetase